MQPPIGQAWRSGDRVYLRWRMRFGEDTRWDPTIGTGENKLIAYGEARETPESRTLVLLHNATEGNACTLGWRDYDDVFGNGGEARYWLPSAFGLDLAGDAWTDEYVAIKPHLGIGTFCTPPVPLTHPGGAAPTLPDSAPPVDGWSWFQLEIRSGDAGEAGYRLWVNQADPDRPTSTTDDAVAPEAIGVFGWDGAVTLGGYATDAQPTDQVYVFGAFEIGSAFDPTFSGE